MPHGPSLILFFLFKHEIIPVICGTFGLLRAGSGSLFSVTLVLLSGLLCPSTVFVDNAVVAFRERKVNKISKILQSGATIGSLRSSSLIVMSRKFGGSAGGGKSSSGLKFQRQEPKFLREIKQQVGYKDSKEDLRNKVTTNWIMERKILEILSLLIFVSILVPVFFRGRRRWSTIG